MSAPRKPLDVSVARSARGRQAAASFEQAENHAPAGELFLQIARPNHQTSRHKLMRVPFQVSRLMEFCSLRELQNQTGHEIRDWLLVVLKELSDNGLDACEEAGIAPSIAISVNSKTGVIAIEDNGPGIAAETIDAVCDYTIRVSSREAYVSPSRGAQGYALKTILAMGYVLDRESRDEEAEAVGQTIIETMGTAHKIRFTVDHITNEPRITHTTTPSPRREGTRIIIKWPHVRPPYDDLSLLEIAEDQFKALAESYVWFNPHLTLRGAWDGVEFVNVKATRPDWIKWRPSDPTSPHWYTETRLQRYLSAHVARDLRLRQDRPVREFIAEFRGLSNTRSRRRSSPRSAAPANRCATSSAGAGPIAAASANCSPR
jgi:hypothetical protein